MVVVLRDDMEVAGEFQLAARAIDAEVGLGDDLELAFLEGEVAGAREVLVEDLFGLGVVVVRADFELPEWGGRYILLES